MEQGDLIMLYIKKFVNQDNEKEIAFQYGPAKDFFHSDCIVTVGGQNDLSIKLIFKTQNQSYSNLNDKTINTSIYFNGKQELRIRSPFKPFLKNEIGISVGDIIIFKRKETTQTTSDIFFDTIEFDVIKQNETKYQLFDSILKENIVTGNKTPTYSCMISDDSYNNFTKTNIEHFNVIYYGAPGSGKSHLVHEYIKNNANKVFTTTFHPEYDYNSFVGAYKPFTEDSGKVTYKFVPQIFLNAYVYAWNHREENVFFNIEEINRGNCAQIFGALFQLLDRNSDGFSSYSIDLDEDAANFLRSKFSKNDEYKNLICEKSNISTDTFEYSKIVIPCNLYLYATMNTSDQSLFPIDSAFKRRWDWIYVPINYEKISDIKIQIENVFYSWSEFLKNVNKRILRITQSEDKQLGTFFVKSQNDIISYQVFRDKVLFYLWNDIYKDEYGTADTIFKNAEQHDFSYSNLFDETSAIELIKDMFKNLGLSPLNNDINSTLDTNNEII